MNVKVLPEPWTTLVGATAIVPDPSGARQSRIDTLSTRHPSQPLELLSVPTRHRAWTFWPCAAAGRLTTTVAKLDGQPTQPDHTFRLRGNGLPWLNPIAL